MKPNVFLSHSKSDKQFIEKVANDLRNARISVWYDEWEIPVGESFRKKIFDDGISACDLFLVYLTNNSINSFWVSRELDAAFIKDAKSKGSSLAIFVDSDEIRNKLPLDVQSLHSPVFNDENYYRPLNQLISRVWEVTSEKRIKNAIESQRINILELEKEKTELQMQLLKLQSLGGIDFEVIETELQNHSYEIRERKISLHEVFSVWALPLASGATIRSLKSSLSKYVNLPDIEHSLYYEGFNEREVIGRLIILGLVRVEPATTETYESFYLTDLGIKCARNLK